MIKKQTNKTKICIYLKIEINVVNNINVIFYFKLKLNMKHYFL